MTLKDEFIIITPDKIERTTNEENIKELIGEKKICDIAEQCTHFCVYKQMFCPVYARIVEKEKNK